MRFTSRRTLLATSSLAASLALMAPAQASAQTTGDTTLRATTTEPIQTEDNDRDWGWLGLLGLLGLAGLRKRPAPVVHETVRTTGTSDPSMRR